jgi:chloramphenicol 3-O-phosphotransferase
MEPITILTGAPGTGKTTLAEVLAGCSPNGLHIPSDLFYHFPAHPIPPHRAEAQAQNEAVIGALLAAARSFAGRGFDVFLDGIFGPWFLPFMARELLPEIQTVHYVILRVERETAVKRVRGRPGYFEDGVVLQMHGEFEAQRDAYARFEVDAGEGEPADLAEEILRRRAEGGFLLDLQSL